MRSKQMWDILVENETLRFYLYGWDGNLSKNVKRDDDNDFEYKDESYRYLPDCQSSSSSKNKNYSTKTFLNKNSRDLGQDMIIICLIFYKTIRPNQFYKKRHGCST